MTELDYDLFASKWGQIGIYMQCVSDNLAINCDKLGERSVAIYATLCSVQPEPHTSESKIQKVLHKI